MPLADPRSFGPGDDASPLLRLASAGGRDALAGALRELAASGKDDEIGAALAAAPSHDLYARLWRALCAAVEKPTPDAAVEARLFAIPWVIVCGASAAATIPCVLADPGALTSVLESNGVFGASRNLGIGNALASIESLERLGPNALLEWSRVPAMRDVPPAPIVLTRGAEEVHVRFLLGAAIVPAHLPDIVETGANIAAWGTPALRAMMGELATPGVQILPMPRPPAGLYTAAFNGRRAGIEAAFNLFMSNTVRRFRSIVGDPEVTLSAHVGGELRVTLSNALDETLTEGFRWPLHPADDLEDVVSSITALVRECRLPDPRYAHAVLPDRSPTGAVLFPTG